ncbi:MAG TPA: sigma-70 family RNA polymerase sigma factor [Chloroflexota bacterium]|nr:sigma-70 family RNA polymerase sigma factor [Chloroflexota bacterium]
MATARDHRGPASHGGAPTLTGAADDRAAEDRAVEDPAAALSAAAARARLGEADSERSSPSGNEERLAVHAEQSRQAVVVVFREEAGRLTSALMRVLGDFSQAEEVVQDAVLVALERWPRDGIPDQPGAWLFTVARRRALDLVRRQSRYREKLMQLEYPLSQEPDDRLRLIFTCCHPALAREAQVGLTLRAVCGLTTAEIARAFLVSEATLAKRLLRARKKIVEAGIRYRLPEPEDLDERLREVLAVLYLLFNEGYLSSGPGAPTRRDLADDAAWLCGLLVKLLPGEPEPLGLLALMRLHLARAASRFDEQGQIVLLQDQDRTLWDRQALGQAQALLAAAARGRKPGPFQLQAAIVAVHAEAASWSETDWPQVLGLYDAMLRMTPTAVVRLNRAVAVRHVHGPAAALEEVEALAEPLGGYYLWHAVRGELLRALGREAQAMAADRQALALTQNAAERTLLERRLGAV